MSELGDFDADPTEATKVEPADFGGGESTGVQDLNGEADDMEDTDTTETDDVAQADEVIERRDVGASISVDISRGSGTRDQEKWCLKGKGPNAEAAIAELRTQLEGVVGPLDESPMAEQVRSFQPSNAPTGDE